MCGGARVEGECWVCVGLELGSLVRIVRELGEGLTGWAGKEETWAREKERERERERGI